VVNTLKQYGRNPLKIHHLNCGTLCPFTGKKIIQKIPFLKKWVTLVCHCLLIETNNELILVDTGLGIKDITHNDRFFSNLLFSNFAKPILDLKETAYHQVINLGLDPKDVKHIIATHLDADHIGGIADFPHAKIHILEQEWQAAFGDKSLFEMTRYLPEQFRHGPIWERYRVAGDKWNGFEAVRQLTGLPPEILLIPLPGHTRGHAGVVVDTGTSKEFFVGDAYMHRNQLLRKSPPAYIPLYNKLIQTDLKAFELNLERLSDLQDQNDNIEIYCSHDTSEYECMCSSKALRSK
jgi:glyoxylase-like metal-dependent hydrolase (beta-lactamase superfamily II)